LSESEGLSMTACKLSGREMAAEIVLVAVNMAAVRAGCPTRYERVAALSSDVDRARLSISDLVHGSKEGHGGRQEVEVHGWRTVRSLHSLKEEVEEVASRASASMVVKAQAGHGASRAIRLEQRCSAVEMIVLCTLYESDEDVRLISLDVSRSFSVCNGSFPRCSTDCLRLQ
jgi:hypothetical protein